MCIFTESSLFPYANFLSVPGITEFIAMSDTPIRTPAPEWSRGLSQEDTTAMISEFKLYIMFYALLFFLLI